MSQFENMMDKIREDQKVPERVWKKLDYVLDDLPDCEDIPAAGGRGRKYAAAAAVAITAGVSLCISNPALAAKIPFIGKIFEEVESSIPFSGNYSEKAGLLGEVAEKDKEGKPLASPGIVKSDGGITVTASEVYCDGLSVFLTAQVEVEQGGLENMPAHYIDDSDATSEMMYLGGEWNLSGDNKTQSLMNDNLEGKVIDDHTFVGMLKLNLTDYTQAEGELSLRLSSIGWDDMTMAGAEDTAESDGVEGQWDFDIPFTVDTKSAKEYEVNVSGGGYTIQKVFVSPYQVVSYVDVPFTEREVTREEYDAMAKEKTGGEGDFGLTYEEYAEEVRRTYQMWDTVICNQDGEMLFSDQESIGKSVAAVDWKKVSALHVFVFDDMDAAIEVIKSRLDKGTINIQEAAGKAAVTAEVTVER